MHYHYVVIWDTETESFKLDWGSTIAVYEDAEIWDGFNKIAAKDFPAINTDYDLVSDKLTELLGGSYI